MPAPDLHCCSRVYGSVGWSTSDGHTVQKLVEASAPFSSRSHCILEEYHEGYLSLATSNRYCIPTARLRQWQKWTEEQTLFYGSPRDCPCCSLYVSVFISLKALVVGYRFRHQRCTHRHLLSPPQHLAYGHHAQIALTSQNFKVALASSSACRPLLILLAAILQRRRRKKVD